MNISPSLQKFVQQKLENHLGHLTNDIRFSSIGGGSINQTYKISAGANLFFCKTNSATKFPHLFEKEAKGLKLIQQQHLIKTPKPVEYFEVENTQFLLLEWIEEGERNKNFWRLFGEQLAAVHQVSNVHFGLDEDNFMGSVPQCNNQDDDWIRFFRDNRLQPMIELCINRQLLDLTHQKYFEKLFDQLPSIFDDQQKPALVHGDLWSGNFMCNHQSQPVLIDPAVYYGHPAVDLGMTTLFGGFQQGFYDAYHYNSPLPRNYREQWEVCNLYPLLIHVFLFGSSYLRQVEQTLSRFQ